MNGLLWPGEYTGTEGWQGFYWAELALRDGLPPTAPKNRHYGAMPPEESLGTYDFPRDLSPDGVFLYYWDRDDEGGDVLMQHDTRTETTREFWAGKGEKALRRWAVSHRYVALQLGNTQHWDEFELVLIDSQSGAVRVLELPPPPSYIGQMTFSHDGNRLALLMEASDTSFYLYDVAMAAPAPVPVSGLYTDVTGSRAMGATLCFSPDDNYLILLSNSWDFNALEIIRVESVFPFKADLARYEDVTGLAAACWVGDNLLMAHWAYDNPDRTGFSRYDFKTHQRYKLPFGFADDPGMRVFGLSYDAVLQRLWLSHERVWSPSGNGVYLSCLDLKAWAQGGTHYAQPVQACPGDMERPPLCQHGMGQIKGSVFDQNNQRVARTVQAFSREDGRLLGQTQSSAIDGRYRLFVPDVNEPCDVVFRALDGEGLNDLIVTRVKPQPLRDVADFIDWPDSLLYPPLAGQALPLPTPPKPPPPPPKTPPKPANPPPVPAKRPPKPADIAPMRIYANYNDVYQNDASYVGQPGWLYMMWYLLANTSRCVLGLTTSHALPLALPSSAGRLVRWVRRALLLDLLSRVCSEIGTAQ